MSNRSREKTGSTMDSDSKRLPAQLSDEQWSLISDLFPDKPMGPQVGARRYRLELVLKESSGVFEAVPAGKIFLRAFRLMPLVGG